jgi:hydroxyethylthiazole kinase-like sugar kinase family protein
LEGPIPGIICKPSFRQAGGGCVLSLTLVCGCLLQAVALNKPWVLDPVGCGATTYRTAACVNMLKLQPTVVRGNASEILALAGAAGETRHRPAAAQEHCVLANCCHSVLQRLAC